MPWVFDFPFFGSPTSNTVKFEGLVRSDFGTLRAQINHPPQDPTHWGPEVALGGGVVSYERGTPVRCRDRINSTEQRETPLGTTF
jgi:hypothetical protein